MAWYWVVILTLTIYWIIGIVIGITTDEDNLIYWSTGLIYPIILIILYPIRTWYTYSKSIAYYKKRNITRFQYMLGKRYDDGNEVYYNRFTPWKRKENKDV